MSYKLKMFDLNREGEVSITQQLVTLFATLIDNGELAPGERLPATRALAADVSVNHLTAVRVYRRLAELGYVTAAVGRGTFVRQRVPVALSTPHAGAGAAVGGRAAPADEDWQVGMLAARPVTYADEMLRDSLHAPLAGDAIPLGSGYPDPELCPSQELAVLAAQVTRDNPRAITDYLQVEGLPELRERLAELGRAAGYATSADEILVTTGARQAIDLVARALLGPGDVRSSSRPRLPARSRRCSPPARASCRCPSMATGRTSTRSSGSSRATRSSSSRCRRPARTRPAPTSRRRAARGCSSSRARAASSSSTTACTRRCASTASRSGACAKRRRRT